MPDWHQFIMNLGSLDADQVEHALLEQGALAVTFSDAADDPVLEPAPGETPLWRESRVTALFDASRDLSQLADQLTEKLALESTPAHHIESLADRDWAREWLRDFRPMRFGDRLWIVPGDAECPDDDAVVVRLDPGLAFGTGTHATTALCLEWLDNAKLDGVEVLDFGCGSGILGIAALKLGAVEVMAVDVDLQAVSATRQNAERNTVLDRLSASNVMPADAGPYGIVVANILANTLVEHAMELKGALAAGGRIVLSGILAAQVDDVIEAYHDEVEFGPPVIRDEWALVAGSRK